VGYNKEVSKLLDITGQTFGRWTVIKHVGANVQRRALWLCKCVCGNTGLVNGNDIRDGHSTSCGCYAIDVLRKRSIKKDSGKSKLFRQYTGSAKRRGLLFSLTEYEFDFLTQSKCHYCGIEPKQISIKSSNEGKYVYNGIDRKNNNEGYVIENCVSCCYDCNFLKRDRDYDNFISCVITISKNLQLNGVLK